MTSAKKKVTGFIAKVPSFAAVAQDGYSWRDVEGDTDNVVDPGAKNQINSGITSFPKTSVSSAVIISPSSDTPLSLFIRAHELFHARFTPDINNTRAALEKDGYSQLAIQLSEDVRIHHYGTKAGAWPPGAALPANLLAELLKKAETQVEKAAFVIGSRGGRVSSKDEEGRLIDTSSTCQLADVVCAGLEDSESLTEYSRWVLEQYDRHLESILTTDVPRRKSIATLSGITAQYRAIVDLTEKALAAIADPPKDQQDDDQDNDENGNGNEGGGSSGSEGSDGLTALTTSTSPRDVSKGWAHGNKREVDGVKYEKGFGRPGAHKSKESDPGVKDFWDDIGASGSEKKSFLKDLGLGDARESSKLWERVATARSGALTTWLKGERDKTPAATPGASASPSASRKVTTGYVEKGVASGRENESYASAAERGALDTEHGSVWAVMDIAHPDLERETRVKSRARGRGSVSGLIPKHFSRWYVDRAILDSIGTNRGGALLIDCSGSMNWARERTLLMLEFYPALTVAAYSSAVTSNTRGILSILAKGGKMIGQNERWEARHGGGNVCDGAALSWLAHQPGPRLWFSDGLVSGSGENFCSAAVDDAYRILRTGNIYRTRFVSDVFAFFSGRPHRAVQNLGEAGIHSAYGHSSLTAGPEVLQGYLEEKRRRQEEPDTFDDILREAARRGK